MSFYAAFLLGLASSIHCFAMCGALVLAFSGVIAARSRSVTTKNVEILDTPENTTSTTLIVSEHKFSQKVMSVGSAQPVFNHVFFLTSKFYDAVLHPHFLLNAGRVSTYLILAIMLTLFFNVYSLVFQIEEWASTLRIVAGLAIVSSGLQVAFKVSWLRKAEKSTNCLFNSLAKPIKWALASENSMSPLLLGLYWGFLPCGIVYSLLLMAASTGSYLHASFTVLAFGLGTTPALLAVGFVSSSVQRLVNMRRFQFVLGAFIVFCGVWWLSTPVIKRFGIDLSPSLQSFLPACH